MLKMMKVMLLLAAICFNFAQAIPGYYWDNGVSQDGHDMIGPFYMGPYCNYKCPMKCWRMGLQGVCNNYMCMCQQGRFLRPFGSTS